MKTDQYLTINWLPPANCRWPSPAGSILKSFLNNQGIPTRLKYWNLLLRNFQNNFLSIDIDQIEDCSVTLLPFLAQIALHHNDKECCNKIKYKLLANHPEWLNLGKDYLDIRMNESVDLLNKIIDSEIEKMQLDNHFLFGVSSKLTQWLFANSICERVKKRYPSLPIIIGGFGTRDEAVSFMGNFDFYDYAIWGEGEYPLLELCNAIIGGSRETNKISYLVYKSENELVASSIRKKYYLDLNSDIIPDFEDYIDQSEMDKKSLHLTMEGGRGCHWQKCQFW